MTAMFNDALQDSVRIWKSNYLYNQPLLHVMLATSYPAFT